MKGFDIIYMRIEKCRSSFPIKYIRRKVANCIGNLEDLVSYFRTRDKTVVDLEVGIIGMVSLSQNNFFAKFGNLSLIKDQDSLIQIGGSQNTILSRYNVAKIKENI